MTRSGVTTKKSCHALGNRVPVNAFNLDDHARTIGGSIRLADIGLDPARAYVFDEPWASSADGKLVVKASLGPWGAKMASAEGRM